MYAIVLRSLGTSWLSSYLAVVLLMRPSDVRGQVFVNYRSVSSRAVVISASRLIHVYVLASG